MAPPVCKCMKPGRVTRNGYLNFLRDFRKSNCGLSAVEMVRKGAAKWRSMSQKDKCKYNVMAKDAPKVPRRSRMRTRRMRVSKMRSSRMRVGRRLGGRSRSGRMRRSVLVRGSRTRMRNRK